MEEFTKNVKRQYKLVSFSFANGASREVINSPSQQVDMFQNPAVNKKLNEFADDGWRPVSMSNSGHGALFILLEK